MTKIVKKQSSLANKDITIANAVTRSAQGFSLVEKRIIFAGLAQIGNFNREVVLTAQEYAETFDVELNTAYEQLKENVENLRKKYLTFQVQDGKKFGKAVVNWLQGYYYFEKEGLVKFRFSEYIYPYLFELNHEFTKYKLSQACALRSVHSWRLLELFESFRKSNATQKDDDGNTLKTKKSDKGWLKISLDDFIVAMEIKPSYRGSFGRINKYIIEPAIKELQEKDGWKIEYFPIKKGRKVVMLEFEFYRDPQGRLF